MMETQLAYKSFNENKSIEELEFNITEFIMSLKKYKFELHFFKNLLDKPIYNSHARNLYETLLEFKNDIHTLNKGSIDLIDELSSHSKQIRNIIECEDVACDSFFTQKHDAIELKVFNFKTEIFNFKFRLFQYLESVIDN